MPRYLVGIDDTDNHESIGTGALARELMTVLEREIKAQHLGITRHQLLIHPDIPYTSHNSAACLEFETSGSLEDIRRLCRGVLEYLMHPRADCGYCALAEARNPADWQAFGHAAQSRVIEHREAYSLQDGNQVVIEEVGGSGLGVVGAVAACGLRLGADDGRFIALPGLRSLENTLTAGQILERSPIQEIVAEPDGRLLTGDEPVDTQDWVRPVLREGRIRLVVEKNPSSPGWIVNKQDRKLDKH